MSTMKIKRHKSHLLTRYKNIIPDAYSTQKLDLKAVYADSMIEGVFFQKNLFLDIHAFIQKSIQLAPVPEVGGFLLGNYAIDEKGFYKTFVEIFVPSTEVAYNNPNILDFGTQAMVEWDIAREQHPELTSVGWFHTHPGHSPYLSNTDINMHEGFFTQPFQVALVIDPLTEFWDTGLFCRNNDGKMNRYVPNSKFFSWLDLLAS